MMVLILEINKKLKEVSLFDRIKHSKTKITVDKFILYFTYEKMKCENGLTVFDNDKMFEGSIKIEFIE